MLKQQQNISGDGEVAPQGFGRVATKAPPTFSPDNEIDAAHNFFTTNGYVVLNDCLAQAEIDHLIKKETELSSELDRLINDREYIKKIAQEKFHMVNPGEKIFRVIDRRKIK